MKPDTKPSSETFKCEFLRTIVDFANEHHYDDLRLTERLELLSDGERIAEAHVEVVSKAPERTCELAQRAAHARIGLADSDTDPAAAEIIRYVRRMNRQTPFEFREPRNGLGIAPIKVNEESLKYSYARLNSLATDHSTPSSSAALNLLLAAFNSSQHKFDFNDLKRLDRKNKTAALTILIANLMADYESDKALSRRQIDRLLSERHSEPVDQTSDEEQRAAFIPAV